MLERLPAERQGWAARDQDAGTRGLVRRFTEEASGWTLTPSSHAARGRPLLDADHARACPSAAIAETLTFHADQFLRFGLPERLS